MPKPSVAAEVHEPLDVHLNLAPQIAFHLVVAVEKVADFLDVGLGQLFRRLRRRDASALSDPASRGFADAEEVRQRVNDLLVTREVDS